LSNEKPNLLDPSYFELAFETGQQPPGKRLKAWRKVQTLKAYILAGNLARNGFAKQNTR
jgi:hypothetical protein